MPIVPINLTKTICLTVLVMLAILYGCKTNKNVQDGFETKKLNKIWSTDRMADGALEIQSNTVRKGNGAAKITLNTGDVFEAGDQDSHDSERDELCEAERFWSVENKLYLYEFSLFLPDTFLIVPTRLVIAQWKQKCPHGGSCSGDSPVLAIRYVAGRLYITLQKDSTQQVLFQTREEIRNKWLDFKFRVRFSRSENGEITAWLNEKQLVNFKGITCYTSKNGYSASSLFYFKTGLYRNVMPQPMTIYVDEYKKTQLNTE